MTEMLAAAAKPAPRRGRGRPASNAPNVLDEEALLGAAFAVFAERGYDACTVRDLSRRLGVSHNLLNVRFGRKDDLWKAAVDWRFSRASRPVEAAFDSVASPEQRLRDLIERFCDWALVNSDIVGISQQEAHVESWRIDYVYSHFTGPFQARLETLLEDVRRSRPLAELSSGALLSILVHGVGMLFAAEPMRRRLDRAVAQADDIHKLHARRFARFICDGLFPEG